MSSLGAVAFGIGLLLGIRVMFFGVQRRLDEEHVLLRRWPLTLAAFFMVTGVVLYVGASRSEAGVQLLATALLAGAIAGWGAWALVRHSATAPSTDPEDDPEFRFQGQVARVVEGIVPRGGQPPAGRIAFEFDGRRYEFRAQWTPGDWRPEQGRADAEVVIERVTDDLAFVEPWAAIEERL
ncbi:MAG TPA: hypothetical protein VJ867_05465 [Gemmatimonadaceae bacterium]|nr:hypothetical protein [Gemmatimonadaceae bacterium]